MSINSSKMLNVIEGTQDTCNKDSSQRLSWNRVDSNPVDLQKKIKSYRAILNQYKIEGQTQTLNRMLIRIVKKDNIPQVMQRKALLRSLLEIVEEFMMNELEVAL